MPEPQVAPSRRGPSLATPARRKTCRDLSGPRLSGAGARRLREGHPSTRTALVDASFVGWRAAHLLERLRGEQRPAEAPLEHLGEGEVERAGDVAREQARPRLGRLQRGRGGAGRQWLVGASQSGVGGRIPLSCKTQEKTRGGSGREGDVEREEGESPTWNLERWGSRRDPLAKRPEYGVTRPRAALRWATTPASRLARGVRWCRLASV